MPLVLVGQNNDMTWGYHHPLDVTDIYAERWCPTPARPVGVDAVQGQLEWVIPVPETFSNNVRLGTAPRRRRAGAGRAGGFRRGAHCAAPQQWADRCRLGGGRGAQRAVHGVQRHARAGHVPAAEPRRNLADFEARAAFFDVGSQNFVYADVDGNIAYFTSAEMPLREDLQAGTVNGAPPWFIRNGQGGNEWLSPDPHAASGTGDPVAARCRDAAHDQPALASW